MTFFRKRFFEHPEIAFPDGTSVYAQEYQTNDLNIVKASFDDNSVGDTEDAQRDEFDSAWYTELQFCFSTWTLQEYQSGTDFLNIDFRRFYRVKRLGPMHWVMLWIFDEDKNPETGKKHRTLPLDHQMILFCVSPLNRNAYKEAIFNKQHELFSEGPFDELFDKKVEKKANSQNISKEEVIAQYEKEEKELSEWKDLPFQYMIVLERSFQFRRGQFRSLANQ
jgi:hypothetical protein